MVKVELSELGKTWDLKIVLCTCKTLTVSNLKFDFQFAKTV